MLNKRIITSVVLLPIVIWGVFFASRGQFLVLTIFIFLGCAVEWARLIDISGFWKRFFFLLFISMTMTTVYYMPLQFLLTFTLLCWLVGLFWVVRYPRNTEQWNKISIFLLYGVIVLLPCWVALNVLHNNYSSQLLMYLLLLVWAADVGAFFIGQHWGRVKLAVDVSPGKTIEGVLGGLGIGLVIALLAGIWFQVQLSLWPFWLLLAIATVLMSVVGDLLISMYKRNRGVKDTGHILPGHGGLLDRLDSLSAAAPVFLLGMIILQIPMTYPSLW